MDLWQRRRKFEDVFELGGIAQFAELGMVSILLASSGIEASCLKMAVGLSANPDALVGGRDGEGLDSVARSLIDSKALVVGFEVEFVARADSPNAGLPIGNVP